MNRWFRARFYSEDTEVGWDEVPVKAFYKNAKEGRVRLCNEILKQRII